MCICSDLKYSPKNHDHFQYITQADLNAALASYYTRTEVDNLLADVISQIEDILPVGTIVGWPIAAIPDNWLICNGMTFDDSPAGYPLLFSALGTNTLPNLMGRVMVGVNSADSDMDAPLETGGEKFHILSIAEMPAHNNAIAHSGHTGYVFVRDTVDGNIIWTTTTTTPGSGFSQGFASSNGGGDPHNNMPPFLAVHHIIKGR